ncbi:MAG: D-alanyl-D-alanine carboxypeptidase/D-alanyl-D-alanine-endopeptidase [Saprospiraceae bacterium]|nr:D-alanyl-D-alanine carboxypeptidase/D-alanyl-D-alanine-endopeptidase [Saprospiraceae bacterium]
MHTKVFKLICFLLFAANVNAQSALQNYVDEWVQHPFFKNSEISFAVHGIESQKLLAGHRMSKSAIPASSLKVLTTFIIYEELGYDFTYKTQLAHDGTIDSDGTLQGNLYFIGSGDPSLGSGRFDSFPNFDQLMDTIVSKVVKHGITCIDGDIIVDNSIFDAFPIGSTWQWNDLGNYYAGGTWGFNINENEYSIFYNTKKKIGQRASYSYQNPVIPGLELEHEVIVDSANTGDNSYIFGGPLVYQKRVMGKLPYDEKPFKIKGSIPDPPKFAAYSIYNYLQKKDIASAGFEVINKPSPIVLQYFDTLVSPQLGLLCEQTNHRSINQYCDAFLKTLGLRMRGKGSSEDGIAYVEEYLMAMDIDINGLNMKDGSGLSARSYVPAELLSSFIAKYAAKHSIETIQHLLPEAGKEGSVKGVLLGAKIAPNFWMKSGSMDRVLSYTGICKTKSGKWVSFSIIVNNYNVKFRDVKYRVERLFDAIYTYG